MARFAKLTAIVSALALLLSFAAVPAMAAGEEITYYLNEDFETGYTNTSIGTVGETEYFVAGNAALGDKFGYTPDTNTGIDVEAGTAPLWNSKVENGRLMLFTNGATESKSATAHFAYRKFDTTLRAEDAVISFTLTGQIGRYPTFKLVNSLGEDLLTIRLMSASRGYYVKSYAPGTSGTARYADGKSLDFAAPYTEQSQGAYFTDFKYDETVTVYIYPDFEARTVGLAFGDGSGNYQVVDSFIRMSSASAVYDVDQIKFISGYSYKVGNNDTYDSTFYFDNIVAKDMTAAEKAAYNAAIEEDFVTKSYEENFEWGTDYQTFTNNTDGLDYSVVYKAGSTITSASVKEDASINYYMPNTNVFTTSIVNDAEKGQVLDINGTSMKASRGVFVNLSDVTSRFIELQYDFKSFNGAGLTNYVNFKYINATGTETSASTVQAPVHMNKINVQGAKIGTTSALSKENFYNRFFDPEELDDGKLKTEQWHNIKYLFDCKTATYDVFVDGRLIASDCVRRSADSQNPASAPMLTFDKILIGPAANGAFHVQLDGVKVRTVSPLTAANITKAGFENLIGDGVFDKTSRIGADIKFYLPNQGTFGTNVFEHGAYKIVDADGTTVLFEKKGEPTLTYALAEGVEFGADGITVKTDTHPAAIGARSLKWIENPLAVHKMNTAATEEQKADVNLILADINGLTTYNSAGTLFGNETYLVPSNLDGRNSDVDWSFTVKFQKGDAVVTGDYTITLKRDLVEGYVDGLEIGKPAAEGYANGKITSTYGYFQTNTYIVNNSDAPKTIMAIMACYDVNGELILAQPSTVTLAVGEGQRIGVSQGGLNGSNAYLKEDTCAVKFFVWERGTLTPVMANVASLPAAQ